MNQKITKFLTSASESYYAGCPIISDEVFDVLADSIGFSQVGAKAQGKTATHTYQLFSLQKHYTKDGVAPLSEYTAGEKCITPKIDGAAISLLYIDGELVQGLTRGDGKVGQIITDKVLKASYIPKTIPTHGVVQISGEIAAPSHVDNARNYAAGSLNLKDSTEFATRALEFFAYGVQPSQKPTYEQDMKVLSKWGFTTIYEPDIDKIYPCDGTVFRLNNNELFYSLGYTSKHPRGAFALKEEQEAIITTLLDVEWSTSKTGRVNPVAILEPVYIGDALVSRATLNNVEFIEALGLEIGDEVFVIRSGMIIPTITGKANQ
jgi:DNA ligase (NAD+)